MLPMEQLHNWAVGTHDHSHQKQSAHDCNQLQTYHRIILPDALDQLAHVEHVLTEFPRRLCQVFFHIWVGQHLDSLDQFP